MCPIAVVLSPSSNRHPQMPPLSSPTSSPSAAAAASLPLPLPLLLPSTLLSQPSLLLPSLSTLLCQPCFVIINVVVLLSSQSEKLDQTMPQRHSPWHADVAPTLGSAAQGPAPLIQGHYVPDVALSEISMSWAMEVELRYTTVGGTYFYGKLRERKMKNYAGTFSL
jgi:hypothetical protein